MKQTKRMLALLLAAAMGIMQMPAAGVYAEDGSDPEQTVIAAEETPEDTTEEMAPTDGPIALTVGKPYTLYNVPYSGYEQGKITVDITQGAAIAGLSRSEDGLWMQLTATAPGMIFLDIRSEYNDGIITDAYGRAKMTDMVFEAVSEPGTGTATNNSSYSLDVGQAKAIHFWDPATMTAEDAEITVIQGEDLIKVSYLPGSDHVDVTAEGEGIAILEIREKNTDAPCSVRLKIGDPEDVTHPYYDPTEYPEEYPTTTVVTTDPQETQLTAYIGYDFYNEPWIFPVGTEPTFRSANLIFYANMFDTLRKTGFTAASGENDNLYRFDTSRVDIDTCGMYPFYLHTNGGVTKMLTTYAQNLNEGTYYFDLKEHDELGFVYMDDGKEKPCTVPTVDATNEEALDVGRFTKLNYAEPWLYTPDYTIEVEDPNVIAAYCNTEDGSVYVMGIGSGDSQVTVRDADGEVRSAVKYIVYPAATTTTAPEEPVGTATTTTTTVTTKVTDPTEPVDTTAVSTKPQATETTTTIPVYTTTAVSTEFQTTETSTTTTTTTPGHGPELIVDKSPMMIGETRLVTVVPPDGNGTVERLYNFDVTDNLSYEYAGSGNEFYITALAPGRAKVYVSAEGEGLQLYLDYGYCILTITEETAPSTEVTTYSTETKTEETTVAVKEPSLGDLDGDAQVNAKDAADILIDAATCGATGEHSLPAEVLDFADVNKNGTIDAEDASYVLTYAAEAGGNPKIATFEVYMDEQIAKPVHIFSGHFIKSKEDILGTTGIITSKEDLLWELGDMEPDEYLSGCDDAFFEERSLAVFYFSEYIDNVEYTYQGAEVNSYGNNVIHIGHTATLTNETAADYAYWALWLEVDKTITSTDQIFIDTEYKTVSPAGDPHVQNVQFFRFSTMREASGTVMYIASAEALKDYFSDTESDWVQTLGQSKEELDALLAKYDDAYFAEHTLFLAARTEGSGSITLKYADTTVDINGKNYVNIQRLAPQTGTCDMAYWFLFIEGDKELTDIQIEYHDIYC